jgi:hypothetical protein
MRFFDRSTECIVRETCAVVELVGADAILDGELVPIALIADTR